MKIENSAISTVFTGSALSLVCNIALSEAVDTDVDILTTWTIGGQVVMSDGRRVLEHTEETSHLMYQTTLSISPLSDTLDSGVFSCSVTVTPSSTSLYIYI